MSASPPNESEPVPPSRFILDLDQPLQLDALLECLELVRYPPPALEKPGPERQWRAQLWVRLSYLLMHCSLTRSGDSCADLATLGKHHSVLAQRLLLQEWRLSRASPTSFQV